MKWFQMLVDSNKHFEDSAYCHGKLLTSVNILSSGILLNGLLINQEKIEELSFIPIVK